MSNIEKIRQEIERRKKICEGIFERESDTYYQGKAVAYGELLAFIDSLPEETCKDSLQVSETCKENKDSFIDDLEEAAKEYATDILPSGDETYIYTDGRAYYGFIAGAEWQKEQMMKDAVEAKIYGYDDGSFELIASWLDIPNNSIYKDGDKVKIIIVKK